MACAIQISSLGDLSEAYFELVAPGKKQLGARQACAGAEEAEKRKAGRALDFP